MNAHSHYVYEHRRGHEASTYEVRRGDGRRGHGAVVETFSARPDPCEGYFRPWMATREHDHQVRSRAQAFADALNAGGIRRERALGRRHGAQQG